MWLFCKLFLKTLDFNNSSNQILLNWGKDCGKMIRTMNKTWLIGSNGNKTWKRQWYVYTMKQINPLLLTSKRIISPVYISSTKKERENGEWTKVEDVFTVMGIRPGRGSDTYTPWGYKSWMSDFAPGKNQTLCSECC